MGRSSGKQARRTLGGRGPDGVQRDGVVGRERAGAGPPQGSQVRGVAEPFAEVAGEGPDVGPGPAPDLDDRDRPLRVGTIPVEEVDGVDGHRSLGQLDGLPGPGHGVGPSTGDLDGGEGRGSLLDRPGQTRKRRLDGLAGRRGSVTRGQLALEVVGRRRGAEADRRPIGLVVGQVELDDAGRLAQEHGQHARCERVQRAAVPDALGGGQPSDEADDVVRRRSDRLVDDEDAVETRAE